MMFTEGVVVYTVIVCMMLLYQHYLWEGEYEMSVMMWLLFMATLLVTVLA